MEKGITYLPLPPSFFFLSLFSVGFFAFDVSALRGQRRREGRGAVAVRAVANVEGGGGTDGRTEEGCSPSTVLLQGLEERTDALAAKKTKPTDRGRRRRRWWGPIFVWPESSPPPPLPRRRFSFPEKPPH